MPSVAFCCLPQIVVQCTWCELSPVRRDFTRPSHSSPKQRYHFCTLWRIFSPRWDHRPRLMGMISITRWFIDEIVVLYGPALSPSTFLTPFILFWDFGRQTLVSESRWQYLLSSCWARQSEMGQGGTQKILLVLGISLVGALAGDDSGIQTLDATSHVPALSRAKLVPSDSRPMGPRST